jgi:hypothetical protein
VITKAKKSTVNAQTAVICPSKLWPSGLDHGMNGLTHDLDRLRRTYYG